MNKLRPIAFVWCLLSVFLYGGANATVLSGDVVFSTDNSDSSGYIGADNITVASGGSMIVTALTDGIVSVNDTFHVQGDFLHNGMPAVIGDPTFYGQGSFSFTGDNAVVEAKTLKVDGDFINGDGINPWNLDLSVDEIDIAGAFTAQENSSLVINPSYSGDSSLTAGSISIDGNLYMGGPAAGETVIISSSSNYDVYTISTAGTFDVDGEVRSDIGTLVINANDAKISQSVFGSIEFDVNSLSIGGATLNSDPDWKQRLQRVGDGYGGYLGDLITIGSINSTGDILIGGNVDGDLSITSDGDMWVGNDLTGSWDIDVDNIYVLGDVDGNGNLSADTINVGGDLSGDIAANANSMQISENISGTIDFHLGTLSTGGATLNSDPDWRQRLQHLSDGAGGYIGDLFADGSIETTGDILIGGDVNGSLDITSAADMWVGENLIGYWSIVVDNLYVLGNISGSGNISADTINVGGDLSGDINIDANELIVQHDVLGGTKFRPNTPTGPDGFHINPDTGNTGPFKQIDVSIGGTYYFNNDSYLQLVLNSATAASDGDAAYDPLLDDALLKVGGFDASAVTNPPNFEDMDSTPNIEILVDNINETIRKIRLIEITDPSGVIDLGGMNFAGIWFYWDDNGDYMNDRRLFQEAKLVAENGNIYAIVATMNSVEKITAAAPDASGNDIQMAKAIDDLIITRLRNYSGYTDDNLDNYYTSVMRILFGGNDVYHNLMLDGGAYNDVIDVMVTESPDAALNLVRGMGLDDASTVTSRLGLSARVSKNAVADQLTEDFIWTRYYDKHVAWARMGFGSDITSFNFGADTKVKKFVAGFNLGYNMVSSGNMDASTINLGLYGTYELGKVARLYANANLALHSARANINNPIVGSLKSNFSTADTTLDVGILHKIFDNYVTGRGYLTLGMRGGYEFTQTSGGQDFMDVSADSRMILAPGYELSLGKDIWFTVGSFMRPSLKLGIEYDLIGNDARDLEFKFSESSTWRNWKSSGGDALWIRYGGQIDFSFIVGTHISIGYEVLKNGDFKTNIVKLNGVYRF